ncbi:putative elongation factor [Turkeypox virus]|uniref:Late transcription elongation factor OPG087 n=1 Tax=Turkeypox virus TaxID=336486 RepID=A0A0M3PB54_9POXV|nr:putative elongation factor [Turkeypox virus]ALA62426.1 putative elongation factor [Turkeypox virus]
MSFKELILYNLVKYLMGGDDIYMKTFISLCGSFGVDRVKVLNRFYNSRNTRLISKILKCNDFLNEIELCYPSNILYDLIMLKLDKFTKTIKKSYKLPEYGNGIVIIYNDIILYKGDNNVIDYIKSRYPSSVYRYIEQKIEIATRDIPTDSTVLVFGYKNLEYFTYISSRKILSNTDVKITVTEECINKLLEKPNLKLLDIMFNNKSNNPLSNTLNEIYLSVKSTLYGADSMSNKS